MPTLGSLGGGLLGGPARRFRNVFFSFHYADVVLAAQIRQSWRIRGVHQAGFRDGADWEEVRRRDIPTIRRWIGEQIDGTTVTAVLIGQQTYAREWVRYEIAETVRRGNGLLGIHMHLMNGFDVNARGLLRTPVPGRSPFLDHAPRGQQGIVGSALRIATTLHDEVRTYCWQMNHGYDNFGDWVDEAARTVGR